MICVVKAEDRSDSALPTESRLYTEVQGQHSGVHTVFPNIIHCADEESGTVFTSESILHFDLSPSVCQLLGAMLSASGILLLGCRCMEFLYYPDSGCVFVWSYFRGRRMAPNSVTIFLSIF